MSIRGFLRAKKSLKEALSTIPAPFNPEQWVESVIFD